MDSIDRSIYKKNEEGEVRRDREEMRERETSLGFDRSKVGDKSLVWFGLGRSRLSLGWSFMFLMVRLCFFFSFFQFLGR